MVCESCGAPHVFSRPSLCREHFLEHVESVTSATIARFSLIGDGERVCVAASGGKDSVSLLAVLKRLGYEVHALAVDEGIAGYRDRTLAGLRSFCEDQAIPLRVVSFAEAFGMPLDDMVEGRYPCSVCGVFRRSLLNRFAKGFDVIATGHNLDDEAQVVLMNLAKAHVDLLFRSHVRSPPAEGFVPRIKPFVFLSEKEILAYAVLRGLPVDFKECPHVYLSLRARIRDVLNGCDPGYKRRLVEASLRVAVHERSTVLGTCETCGEPAVDGRCRACRLREEVVS